MRSRRFLSVTALTAVAVLLIGGTAYADDISNDLDAFVDTAAETMNLTAGGATGSTNLRIVIESASAEGPGGKNGCNIAGGQDAVGSASTPRLQLTATSSNPAVATVSQPAAWEDSDACLGTRTVTVTPLTAGSTNITFAIDLSNSLYRGNTDVAPANFNVSVVAPSDPCVTATVPAAPSFDADAPNGDNGWFKATVPASSPAATAVSSTSGAVISYSTDGTTFSSTVPTLGEGTTTVTAKAAAATCASKFSTTARIFKIDLTAPSITNAGPTTLANGSGWYKTAVTNTFNASDGGSGLAGCTASFTKSSGTTEEGSAVTIASGACSDLAGNTNSGIDSAEFKIDMTAPGNLAFSGGPSSGVSYYFGTVPAAPTCTADDTLSLLNENGCRVSGYSAAVGSHTMTASATDNAGNLGTATRSYTVLPWTLKGFYAPVDMNGVLNTVKGGSTVPLKFEIFAGATELTTTDAMESFKVGSIPCATLAGTPTDDIELYSTGGTSLRYDTTGGQFIQNWKIPTGSGICYRVTMLADDGSSTSALFKTK